MALENNHGARLIYTLLEPPPIILIGPGSSRIFPVHQLPVTAPSPAAASSPPRRSPVIEVRRLLPNRHRRAFRC
ncbi:hypothetical protein NL676_007753 [Syzygium grande]|nr:hypothetical protein NL676_007753 [Syzygium grande]